ncbi:MAG: hypothetical protein EAX95_05325 [Candidatus Thorarchaeota archaeon]|nr:hypothetical protein [Candidatus Thorarchaeota archaeon]
MSESYSGGAVDDIKVGFKYALRNIPSFFLAMIGILLVTVIFLIAILVVIVLGIVYLSSNGWLDVLALIDFITETFGMWPEPIVVGVAIVYILPLLAPLFVAIGALYGMAREIIESEGTTAEGIFEWYSRRFFSLAGAGFGMFIVIFAPIWSMWATGYVLLDGVIIGFNFDLLVALSVLWGVFSIGSLSMTFPAVIDGNSALLSIGISLSMTKRSFGRIFLVWITYFLVIVALLSPFIWGPIYAPVWFVHMILDPIPYELIAILVIVFIVVPAMAISQSRIYLLLTADEDEVLVEEGHYEPSDTTLSGGL